MASIIAGMVLFSAVGASLAITLRALDRVLIAPAARDVSGPTTAPAKAAAVTAASRSEAAASTAVRSSFQPADVDILWEAQNYAPAGYKGKALPVSGSQIKITAIPYFPGSSSTSLPKRHNR